jgi:hypothetical protein
MVILFVLSEWRGRQRVYLYMYPSNPPPAKSSHPDTTFTTSYWRRYAVLRQPRGGGRAAEGAIRQSRPSPNRPRAADPLVMMSVWDWDTKGTERIGRIGSEALGGALVGLWQVAG